MDGDDRLDRALLALQVASISGFSQSLKGMQVTCLSLCNACREGVPVQRLATGSRGPPTLLAMLSPDNYHPERKPASIKSCSASIKTCQVSNGSPRDIFGS